MNKTTYYKINNSYLANALSFIGFKYQKNGFGSETTYTFIDTNEFRLALTRINNLKKEINIKY